MTFLDDKAPSVHPDNWPDDDVMGPARSVVNGVLIGAGCWLVVLGAIGSFVALVRLGG